MHRRKFLAVAAVGAAHVAAQAPQETVTATATQDRTPRVGIVLSSFSGGADHDGAPIRGLADPQPAGAELTAAQTDTMVRKAIELGATREGGLPAIVGTEDWVLVHVADGADSRVARSLFSFLAERRRGKRFTFTGEISGIDELAARHPAVRLERLDLSSAETVEMPVPGPYASGRLYRVAKVLARCDKILVVAPLEGDPVTGAAPALRSYLAFAPKEKASSAGERIVDLFSYHPADYTLLARTRPNVVIAGADAVAVDTVGASSLGLDPAKIPLLHLAERRGLGCSQIDAIWTRGNEIDEVRRLLAGGKTS